MKILKILLVPMMVLFLVGCGDSDNSSSKDEVKTLKLTNTEYAIPDDVKVVDSKKINGAETKILATGEKEEVAGFIEEKNDKNESTQKSSNFFKNAISIQKGVETIYSQLSNNTSVINNISLLSSQSFQTPYTFTVAHYQLTTANQMKPLDLSNEIINTIAGGTESGLPVADENAPSDTQFRLVIFYGEYEGSTFYISLVVPEKFYPKYETKINDITNASRIIPKGKKFQEASEKFTTSEGSQKADFLFVIDDSGSMSDNQDALSQAASDFTKEMSTSGLEYRSAIITTSYGANDYVNGDAYRILREVGIIENNDTLLKEKLVAGTNGSGTETGIWNAEQALQSTKYGDAVNGPVTSLGMPDANASLSVIIISDEPSQYEYRAGKEFNITDNLFVDRNIKVYSIIKPGDSYEDTGIFDEYNESQYDDLSIVTGGIYADIENRDMNGSLDFSIIMKQIAKDAGGVSSSFILSHPAAIIDKVTVNGAIISPDTINGYTYVQSSKAIVFHGTALPEGGATIEVKYKYYQ